MIESYHPPSISLGHVIEGKRFQKESIIIPTKKKDNTKEITVVDKIPLLKSNLKEINIILLKSFTF
tara:strand:- start:299 stop:496 length:198 start_codon:yes stop_codon:yes gene_type:complete